MGFKGMLEGGEGGEGEGRGVGWNEDCMVVSVRELDGNRM